MTTFFVYVHMRPDFTPFYVGKGRKYRASSLKPRNPHHGNVVAKCGKENVLIEMLPCSCEEEAFLREQIVIKALRAAGVELTNKTNGGEGVSGYVPSEATRARISKSNKGRQVSDETRRLISAKKAGVPLTQAQKEKLSLAWKSRPPVSDETKAKIAAGQRLRPPPSAETRAKISTANKGRHRTEQHREKMAASHVGKKHTPEHRARMSAAMAGRVITKEHAEKIRLGVLRNWEKRRAMKEQTQMDLDYGR